MRCATAGWTRLSGGEKQRVILARALAQQPSLLLLDEPTQHLDIGGKVELLRRLRRLADENRYTVLVVTHELDLAADFSDRVVLLHKGKCLRVGTPAEVYERELLEEVFEAPLEVEMRAGGKPHVILRGPEFLGLLTFWPGSDNLSAAAKWLPANGARGSCETPLVNNHPETPCTGRR